ncbi:MAG: DUF4129 domain-containing protein [Cyanobacteria bacterium P01_A01_bin.114]
MNIAIFNRLEDLLIFPPLYLPPCRYRLIAADTIQDSSWGWRIQLLGNRLTQWVEWQLSRIPIGNGPDPAPIVWPDWLGWFVIWLLLGCLVLLLSLLLWQALNYVQQYRRPRSAQGIATTADGEALHLAAAEWVRKANQLAQAGQWKAACHAFYRAALQKLHDRQWLAHRSSRTDQEYLQQLDSVTQPRPYQLLIRTHERSHFGEEELTEVNLQRCRQAYQELEKS